ncbi:MAG: amidohydrolase family protein, partial [Bryobacteraceae bacterium]|nr:amidohydrolase family protein [Bryobacteraceae bacterium]
MKSLALAVTLALPLMAAEADLILHNGRILTVDAKFSIREAVAIQGNRFAGVGTSREILAKFRGPRTVVIDLGGRTVLPGLIDAHVHALESGLSELRGPLPPLDSIAAIQDY